MGEATFATAQPRRARRAVHGVLLLDKEVGASSNAVLQRAKRLFRAEKAGHTGTLDPLASGLLPICFGAATKLAQVALDADKRYLATLRLGIETSTGDAEGDVVAERPVRVDRVAVEAACAGFVGEIAQVPPMHSALKRDGRPLYAWTRAGVEVERPARTVTIGSIEVVAGAADEWTIDVRCSKGTYIRTLAEDIGKALGCGAHLSALRRTASGPLSVDAAITLTALGDLVERAELGGFAAGPGLASRNGPGELETFDEGALDARLLPVDVLVAEWPRIDLDAPEAARFLTGLRRRVADVDAAHVRVHGPEGRFVGVGHVRAGELIADRLLSPVELGVAVPSPYATATSSAVAP